jgi:hypothetical protein
LAARPSRGARLILSDKLAHRCGLRVLTQAKQLARSLVEEIKKRTTQMGRSFFNLPGLNEVRTYLIQNNVVFGKKMTLNRFLGEQ